MMQEGTFGDIKGCIAKSSVTFNVVRRSRESRYQMVPVEDAMKMIADELETYEKEAVVLPVDRASNHVLMDPVYSPEALPAFAASVKDGYAVIAADGEGFRKVVRPEFSSNRTASFISPFLRHVTHQGLLPDPYALNIGRQRGHKIGSLADLCVGLSFRVGKWQEDIFLPPGCCTRLNTGAPLIKGADAVVEVEQTELIEATDDEETIIKIRNAPRVGQDVRQIGCDIALGECILNAGFRLASSEISVLNSVGIRDVTVAKKPSIAVVSTGDEICENSVNPLPFGKVRDTNRPMLLSLMKEHGFDAEDFGIVPDKPDTILALFSAMYRNVDVVISSGGMSMGDRDLLKEVLMHDLGFKLHFGRMFMKPGKPTAFMTGYMFNRRKFFFGLPGNPVSAWVTAHICVLPALFRMEGQHCDPFPIVSVT